MVVLKGVFPPLREHRPKFPPIHPLATVHESARLHPLPEWPVAAVWPYFLSEASRVEVSAHDCGPICKRLHDRPYDAIEARKHCRIGIGVGAREITGSPLPRSTDALATRPGYSPQSGISTKDTA